MNLTELLSKDNIISSVSQRVLQKHPNVKGECEIIAKDLTQELKKRGVSAKHIVGTFILDEPDAEQYMDCDDWDGQDEYSVNHDWVEVEGKILDISAKQFRKSVQDSIPDIVYITHSHPLYARYQFLNYYGGN